MLSASYGLMFAMAFMNVWSFMTGNHDPVTLHVLGFAAMYVYTIVTGTIWLRHVIENGGTSRM